MSTGSAAGDPDPSGAPAVRTMSIYRRYLRLIAAGSKAVEVRVGYPSMRKIAAGDRIRFVSGDEECLTTVTRVTEYPSFEAMLDHEDAGSIGADEHGSREELLAAIRTIYPPGKEALGVLAIGVEVAGRD
jgi:ASC-1-like (ASCH) protein